jgi:hypothetical protein
MSTVKEAVKSKLPAPVYNVLRESRDALVRASMWPAAAFHPWRRDSVQRLAELQDKPRGKRCFLIGNGPSLKQTDMSKLKGEFTLGTNRIYLAFPKHEFDLSYYLSVNDLVVEQCAEDIQCLPMPRFISWRGRKWIKPQENLFFIHTTYTGEKFAKDIRGRVWEGGTVTYTALQVAFYLGFSQVILVGVDHNYVTPGKPNETVTSQGDDPNHFDPGYFGKGFRWQLPDLVQWEEAYRLARRTYEADGRSVIDATIGGKLRVFDKVDYNSLF